MEKEKRPYDRYNTKFVGVRIPNELHKVLFTLSKETDTSASQVLVDALYDKLHRIGKIPQSNVSQ